MKIKNLKIQNFKAIKYLELNNLSDTILIAGPNGCGKSCIFHAIRLLKSFIGGYQDNEWHLWFNEFQIRPEDIHHRIIDLFQTNDKDLHIEADFELHNSEKDFLIKEGKRMLEFKLWKQKMPSFGNLNQYQPQSYKYRPLGVQYDAIYHQEIHPKSKEEFTKLEKNLKESIFKAEFTAKKDGNIRVFAPDVLQLAFSSYEEDLGIIDYHGPDRNYHKESLENINLNIQTSRQTMIQHSLYNTQNKYANVKQEMVGNYIKELFIKEAGGMSNSEDSDLIDTLKELFKEFFPEKKFLGPKPDIRGRIDFPVKLPNGKNHDINDLSSGEKEVLYGYLKLRNSAPKNSIILLDEPELHLNPRLISSLPRFYKKHLGDSLGNQLWLVTHSDEFLRQAVEEQNFQVYHLQSSSNSLSYDDNQIKKIDANNKLEKAIIDLVGDLATYAPNKKIVLLEGENSEFDLKMIKNLFPEFEEEVNLLSVGSKHKVTELRKLLDEATRRSKLKTQFFSIVDRDLDNSSERDSVKHFVWDRYHIENYLLEEDYLVKAINELTLGEYSDAQKINDLMIQCAKKSIKPLINHNLRQQAWKDTFGQAKLDFDPNDTNIPRAVYQSIERNLNRIKRISSDEKYLEKLKNINEEKKKDFDISFKNEAWKSKVRGRDVLKKLVSKMQHQKISYESLKNITIILMAKDGYKPEGMKKIIEQIHNI